MTSRRCLWKTIGWISLAAGLVLAGELDSALAQCDPPLPPPPPPDDGGVMLYSLNGQTVQADPSGSFLISNVAAPDVAPADFMGDDYLFLTAVKITDQQTLYAFGRIPFRITPGGRFVFETGADKQAFSTFTTTPPVLPESIALTTLANPVITPLGSDGQCPNAVPCSVPLQTMATLSDGSPPAPVTLPCQWTTYRTSNANIARVIPDQPCPTQTPCDPLDSCRPTGMLVEGVSTGVAFITATNGGATSVVKITVANPGDLISTTVEGFVRRTDASAVSGAIVTVRMDDGSPVSQSMNSDATGFFSIGPVPLPDTTPGVFAQATVDASVSEAGNSATAAPIPGGITDVGIITIDIVCDTPWSTAFGPTTFEGFDIFAMAVFDDDGSGPNPPALFVGGRFSTAGGTPANNIAKWNGQAWEPLVDSVTAVDGVNEVVNGLAVLDLNDGNGLALYVAGGFARAGGTGANKIARWNGSNWSSISGNGDGVGMSHNSASAIAAFDDGTGNGTELYVGGSFAVAGLVIGNQCLPANGCVDTYSIAKWNPTTKAWSAVGAMGINTGPVNALAVFDDDGPGMNPPVLYIGGEFRLIGSPTVWNMAKWDGVSLSGVGYDGLPGSFGNRVTSLTVFDDGSGVGTALYAAGQFIDPKNSGNPPVTVNLRNIARWDGSAWSALGNSLDDDVLALAGLDDGVNRILYAGGQFLGVEGGGSGLRRVAQWNGTAWSPMGTGIESFGTALTVFDDGTGAALYVGDVLCLDCPVPPGARFDFRADRRKEHRSIRRASVKDDAASSRTTIVGYVAKWTDSTWSVLSNGLNDEIRALAVFDDDGSGPDPPALFAGGMFTPPPGPRDDNDPPFPTNAIAKFDGVKWSSLGTGLTNYDTDLPLPNLLPAAAEVHALAVFDEDGAAPDPPRLFAGGDFAFADGISANNVAQWNGTNWSAVGSVGGIVETLAVFDDDGTGLNPSALYAGGLFTGGIKMWNGAAWTTLGGGVTGSVFAATVFNGQLYVGGSFTDAGGVPGTDFLARWDGSAWSAVGSGVTDAVYALTVFDDGTGPALFAGGEFLMPVAGGITANRVAKWDGVAWSALGDGLGPTSVSAIRVDTLFGFDDGSGPCLVAGGRFTSAPAPGGGTIPLNRLAKWNPILDEWSAVGVSIQPGSDPGGGVDGTGTVAVQALALFDDGFNGPALFAAGAFETAASVPSSNIAKLGCR